MRWLTFPWSKRPAGAGRAAEELAARYLRRRLYRLEARNYRCRAGEIDLVLRRGGLTVFVEVRSRTEPTPIHPLETIDDHKMKRIAAAARHYLVSKGRINAPARFDVVSVLYPEKKGPPAISHLAGAFTADDMARGRSYR
jgi:putative endonuclease